MDTEEAASAAPTKIQVARDLRRARLRAGISITEAAQIARVTRMSITLWERGTHSIPTEKYFALMHVYEPGDDPPIES
jgi:predicted transcriptional regulator